MSNKGLPKRQKLVGLWLLLSGVSLVGGAIFALWLGSEFQPQGFALAALWLGCLSGGGTILLVGLLLEYQLFSPLRSLQAQLALMVASPEADDPPPPEGWLRGLGPDFVRIRQAWREDRHRIQHAREDGARHAAGIRRQLESLLQLLDISLLLCDRHNRLLLFNPAAEQMFAEHLGFGLGKRLDALLPAHSLIDAMKHLPSDGSPRDTLVPDGERWLRASLRRVPGGEGETLLTLADATASWSSEMGVKATLARLVPALRRNAANLTSVTDALGQLPPESPAALRKRMDNAISEESLALTEHLASLGNCLDELNVQGERLIPLWSNDLWEALDERHQKTKVTPVGLPGWFKGDAPALLEVLSALLDMLTAHSGQQHLDGELRQGEQRAYLELCWRGTPLPQRTLDACLEQPLNNLPMAPSANDILRQHDSTAWSVADPDSQHARLRLPLPASEGLVAPPKRNLARPEFHDFGIADLPPPDDELAACPPRALEVVAFDTETTGLELQRGDRVISIGACRVVNARLLASEVFEQLVNPERPIPALSTSIHGLSDEDVANSPTASEVLPRFHDYIGNAVILAHNASFDMLAIHPPESRLRFAMPVLDTLLISRALDPELDGHDLDSLAKRYSLYFAPGSRHTALGDARVTAELWLALLPRLEARGIDTLAKLLALQASSFDHQDPNAL
ncbi:PolC-type DNA polymerase III [Halomonas halocynthiae]|uniref:3'-5' exonuclease n=1 Tax=Halomonas halocynthiae TaxID=176290 RepID=UPI000428FAC0|nr:3'-5' exonuclease [Halomonas halocynthiae]